MNLPPLLKSCFFHNESSNTSEMKKKFFQVLLPILLTFVCFSCAGPTEKKLDNVEKARNQVQSEQRKTYRCPNKCEGDKTCEEQLVCPHCNMGMEVIVEAHKEDKN